LDAFNAKAASYKALRGAWVKAAAKDTACFRGNSCTKSPSA
jgi:hypothetical protein